MEREEADAGRTAWGDSHTAATGVGGSERQARRTRETLKVADHAYVTCTVAEELRGE